MKVIKKASTPALSRRRFLAIAGAAAAPCGCSASAAAPAPFGDVQAGNVSDLSMVPALRIVDNEPVCIGRDAAGVYAMTLTCTHAGCDMGQRGNVSVQGIVCGCHGSEFDPVGNVVRGPATQPLDHFAVTVDAAGNLTVHGDQIVDAAQRLSV